MTPAPTDSEFAAFVATVRPRLLDALVATYGPVDGRDATADAFSWAWEHWDRMVDVTNPVAYLYRVGQTATRRFTPRPAPAQLTAGAAAGADDLVIDPGLEPALAELSTQQRAAVILVHGYGWTQTDVAAVLHVNVSTVREHLSRGTARLRRRLGEVTSDA